jgi:hypothetical protein
VANAAIACHCLSLCILQGTALEDDLPPVVVVIGTSEESEDVAIKVSTVFISFGSLL